MQPFSAARGLLPTTPDISNRTAEVTIAETGADMSVSPPPDTWPRGPAPPPVPTSPPGGSSPRRAGPEKGPRHGRSHHGPITNHVPRGQIPAHQVPARADESPRRRRALRAHRHPAHAHHRRMLRRCRTGLLHQTPATAQQGKQLETLGWTVILGPLQPTG